MVTTAKEDKKLQEYLSLYLLEARLQEVEAAATRTEKFDGEIHTYLRDRIGRLRREVRTRRKQLKHV